MKLRDRVAIVTGAGRGIGKAIAMLLASEGAKVVVNDIDLETMQQVVDEIKSQGPTAIALKADVVNRAEVQNLVKTTIEHFKEIHILVNNAGVTRPAPLLEITDEDWDAVLDIDLKGVFNCIQAVSSYMMQQRYGKIVNIASVAGTGTSNAGMANYAAAKAGVIQLTKVAARELGRYGINVNAIAPGVIVTDMTYSHRGKEEVERFIEERKKMTVLGRVGQPEDIANLVLFLASEESSFITGQVICADGGRTDRM